MDNKVLLDVVRQVGILRIDGKWKKLSAKKKEYGINFWRVLYDMDDVKNYHHLTRRRRIILRWYTTVIYKDKHIRTGMIYM